MVPAVIALTGGGAAEFTSPQQQGALEHAALGRLLGSLPRHLKTARSGAVESTGDPFGLWANGNMGPSKSRIVNHGFGTCD
jgi:hypothetical protein